MLTTTFKTPRIVLQFANKFSTKVIRHSVHPDLLDGIQQYGIQKLSYIQHTAFNPIYNGHHTALCSETGSGKTLAYLLPSLSRLLYDLKENRENQQISSKCRPILIIAPNTDLVSQIVKTIQTIDLKKQLRIQTLKSLKSKFQREINDKDENSFFSNFQMDSTNFSESICFDSRIRWGQVDIVVFTLGGFEEEYTRMKRKERQSGYKVLLPSTIIFDEADELAHRNHLLFMNIIAQCKFEPSEVIIPNEEVESVNNDKNDKINTIYREPLNIRNLLLEKVQFIFASATLKSKGTFGLETHLTRRIPDLQVITSDYFMKLPKNVELKWIVTDHDWESRVDNLLSILNDGREGHSRVIVFVNSINHCKKLYKILKTKEWPVHLCTSGGFLNNRLDVQKNFNMNEDETMIIISTEIGARGLDWVNAQVVINLQMPFNSTQWIHRAGRTGRLSVENESTGGIVYNLVSSSDDLIVRSIRESLEANGHVEYTRKSHLKRDKNRLATLNKLPLENVERMTRKQRQSELLGVLNSPDTSAAVASKLSGYGLHKFLGTKMTGIKSVNMDEIGENIYSTKEKKEKFLEIYGDKQIIR